MANALTKVNLRIAYSIFTPRFWGKDLIPAPQATITSLILLNHVSYVAIELAAAY